MGLIREPLDIDFVVDPRPLTRSEEQVISNFIRADKDKRKQKDQRKERAIKSQPKHLV